MTEITENDRRRSDANGLLLYTCARCGRVFRAKPGLGTAAGDRVTVCGVILRPPVTHCLLEDEFGKRWWPKNRPVADLLMIQATKPQRVPTKP
jgi:hypothetical protein